MMVTGTPGFYEIEVIDRARAAQIVAACDHDLEAKALVKALAWMLKALDRGDVEWCASCDKSFRDDALEWGAFALWVPRAHIEGDMLPAVALCSRCAALGDLQGRAEAAIADAFPQLGMKQAGRA
jgi:hypothetical protein